MAEISPRNDFSPRMGLPPSLSFDTVYNYVNGRVPASPERRPGKLR